MNSIQRNKLAMLMAVSAFFDRFKSELSILPALSKAIEKFMAMMTEINEVHSIQQGLMQSNTQMKQKEEAEMIQAVVQTAAAMHVYAQVNNLPDLADKTRVSPSTLQKMPDVELKTACLHIYDQAKALDGQLTDYGITSEMIDQLKKEIDDFVALISSPRSAIVTRSQATARLKTLFSDITILLNDQIDQLMVLFKDAQPQVYHTYKAARIIVDLKKTASTGGGNG